MNGNLRMAPLIKIILLGSTKESGNHAKHRRDPIPAQHEISYPSTKAKHKKSSSPSYGESPKKRRRKGAEVDGKIELRRSKRLREKAKR